MFQGASIRRRKPYKFLEAHEQSLHTSLVASVPVVCGTVRDIRSSVVFALDMSSTLFARLRRATHPGTADTLRAFTRKITHDLASRVATCCQEPALGRRCHPDEHTSRPCRGLVADDSRFSPPYLTPADHTISHNTTLQQTQMPVSLARSRCDKLARRPDRHLRWRARDPVVLRRLFGGVGLGGCHRGLESSFPGVEAAGRFLLALCPPQAIAPAGGVVDHTRPHQTRKSRRILGGKLACCTCSA
ncbi:hypothetical protein BC628DRAFT_303567 [Trametes gibbosa]|nr:hypothetical protein BC628DRAFT_303567 [Trametes gibbosa]